MNTFYKLRRKVTQEEYWVLSLHDNEIKISEQLRVLSKRIEKYRQKFVSTGVKFIINSFGGVSCINHKIENIIETRHCIDFPERHWNSSVILFVDSISDHIENVRNARSNNHPDQIQDKMYYMNLLDAIHRRHF